MKRTQAALAISILLAFPFLGKAETMPSQPQEAALVSEGQQEAKKLDSVPENPFDNLVAAIIQQESGGNPLAINVAGKAYFPKTQEDAEGIIANAQSAKKSFDVGLMQVNSWWMNKYNIPPASLLEEETNLFWGKWILNQEIARHGFNWVAVGKYHSPSVERGKNYAWNVYSKLTGKGKSHAYQKDTSKNLPDRSGVWRNLSVQPQGRIINF